MEDIVTIEEKGIVRNADLEEPLKCDNQVGGQGIELLTKQRVFMLRKKTFDVLIIFYAILKLASQLFVQLRKL